MKKNIRFAMLLGLCGLFFTACEQEEEQQIISGNRFRVEAPKFVDNEKTYLQFTDELSRIIYEEGDKVYINGVEFTLSKDGSGTWWANSSQTVTAPELYVAYADGAVADWDESAHTYSFNLNSTRDDANHNKVVLCGTARENGFAITLAPACAILRLNTQGAGTGYSYVKVGFDGTRIPKQGTVTPASHTLSASGSQFLAGVTQGGAGEFLYMTHSKSSAGESDYWYVAIPITGSSVTTTLYLEWNNGTETIRHKTQGEVTLQKGYVYTIGTERQSPFYADGTSKCFFKVANGMTKYVSFSPGNLVAKLVMSGGAHTEWEFASSQLSYVGSENESNIYNPGQPYDLFGFGTSDWNGRSSYTSTDDVSDYAQFSLTGDNANADWGVYNGASIKYGSLASGTTWRTLTSAEWTYLLNRSGKCALATVNGKKGLILLPDLNASSSAWVYDDEISAPRPSFTAGYSSYSANNYSQAEWDKLEAAGVIFLPAAGMRYGDSDATITDMVTTHGFYWSSTYGSSYQANALVFSAGSATVSAEDNLITNGCAVRLVHQQW